MGFFSKIKKVLQQGEEALHLAPRDAIEHLEQAEHRIIREFEEALSDLSKRFDHETGKTRRNIKLLESGELLNKKIEHRHRQIMEGNRDSYVSKVELFLEHIDEHQPIPKHRARPIAKSFRERLENLVRSTQKSYFVLQEFLANESRAIAGNIKVFDGLVSELEGELEQQKELLARLEKTRKHLEQITLGPERERELEEALTETENALEKVEQKLGAYRDSKDFGKLESLRKKREEIEERRKELRNDLARRLSLLDRALRKYERIALEPKPVQQVLGKEPEQLLENPEPVLKALPGLQKAVISEQVKLKQRTVEKVRAAVDELAAEMESLSGEYLALAKELKGIEKSISGSAAAKKERRLSKAVERAKQDLAEARQRLQEIEGDEQASIDGKHLEQELEVLLDAPIRLLTGDS